jgi:hypothetical protein
MKEAIITKIIPRTHKTILLFFLVTFFLVFFIYIALLEGLSLDRFTINGIKVEKLYLKWDKALHIKAEKIDFSEYVSDGTPLTIEPLAKLPKTIRFVESWVSSIKINIIQYKNFRASLFFQRESAGTVIIHKNDTRYVGAFDLNETAFNLSIPHYIHNDANISFHLFTDLTRQTFKSEIDFQLPSTPMIKLFFSGNSDTLRFHSRVGTPLTTVKPIVDFFDIDPEVKPWIIDYAKGSSITLLNLYGTFHYDKPEELLTSLRADAVVHDAEYTFAQGFEPIRASHVNLNFKEGKLYILPHNGTFYTLPTEQSYLTIDFTTEHTMLDAYIKTQHGKLNDPITNLLSYYNIKLPIKQIKGECAVDLHLNVNLYGLDTTAKGLFIPTSSTILLDKIPLKTDGGIVKVQQSHVTFENFTAYYDDNVARAKVDGEYDASNERGIVSINVDELSPNKNLTLFSPLDPLRITYIISPKGDFLEVKKSHLKLFGEKLTIQPFRAPFNYQQVLCSVPSVPFTYAQGVKGSFNALFNGSKNDALLTIQLKQFQFEKIKLQNAPFDLKVHYNNNKTLLEVKHSSSWSIHELPLLLSPFSATLETNSISFDRIESVLSDWFKGNFSGNYRFDTNSGTITISDMTPISPKVSPLIDKKESVKLIMKSQNDSISIDAPALKSHFSTVANGWKIVLDDISLLSQKSPILRHYHIDNGFLNLFYTGSNSRYQFNGEIKYRYPLMVINDLPLTQYRFSGSYQNGLSTIRVNDRITITQYPEEIYVRANNTGLNLPILFEFLDEHQGDSNTSSEPSLPVRIYATNSYLYLMKGRKIITDTLDASLNNSTFDASFQHMSGSATLKIRNNLFSIMGEDFNDQFMEHLFALSDFSGGKFSFQAKGETNSFDGLMRVENTILKDYKMMNNVLAFINTVPSLTTFSLPNYNAKGLPVTEGYAHFTYKKGTVGVDNFTLNSPEMKITGTGRTNIYSRDIEGVLTLKTDLGSKIGKVPMVGYILMGDDGSISTTLTLNGKLDDPKVNTAIAKEIVTAPFNILKRTLVYPFLWMMDDTKEAKEP